MRIQVYLSDSSGNNYLSPPEECPICKAGIIPGVCHVATFNTVLSNADRKNGVATFVCPKCNVPFIGTIRRVSEAETSTNYWETIDISPKKAFVTLFEDSIGSFSPLFIEIYNQSEQAEAIGLHQICGMGYRKALEFLIKDFAIYREPEKVQEIQNSLLGKVIDTYIDHVRIKATAKAASWIGNDETHYIRKWVDKDIIDLKRFINSCYHFIVADLDADLADEMINQ